MKIITLSENTAPPGAMHMLAEHGLSLLLEADGKKILFDTGQSISAAHNAEVLGVSLRDIDTIVLSHGHYDHTGGLLEILKKTGPIDVYVHPDIFQKKYSVKNGRTRYIGIPVALKKLENAGARFRLSRKSIVLSENIITTGEIPRTSFEETDRDLFVEENGAMKPDKVLDDQALVVKTEKGAVVLLGCAHAGVINTIEAAKKIAGGRIYGIIGGTHLAGASDAQREKTIEVLKTYDLSLLGASHCTGLKMAARFSHDFSDIFLFNNVGTTVEV